ncbi:MAG: SOS response-associated peptidase [bacterium]
MCGRYSFFSKAQIIEKRFNVSVPKDLQPHFNAAPSQMLPIITNIKPEELSLGLWGLRPKWLDKKQAGFINARAETVQDKPAFKNAFNKHRCLVLADSFFEWQKTGEQKTPYRILLKKEEPFAMAGLFEPYTTNKGKMIPSYTILTTHANKAVANIHDRMPVILKPEEEKIWLGDSMNELSFKEILIPYNSAQMNSYQISKLVNKPQADVPEILDPV